MLFIISDVCLFVSLKHRVYMFMERFTLKVYILPTQTTYPGAAQAVNHSRNYNCIRRFSCVLSSFYRSKRITPVLLLSFERRNRKANGHWNAVKHISGITILLKVRESQGFMTFNNKLENPRNTKMSNLYRLSNSF